MKEEGDLRAGEDDEGGEVGEHAGDADDGHEDGVDDPADEDDRLHRPHLRIPESQEGREGDKSRGGENCWGD